MNGLNTVLRKSAVFLINLRDRILRGFANGELRTIFGIKREYETKGWWMVYSDEVCNLYVSLRVFMAVI